MTLPFVDVTLRRPYPPPVSTFGATFWRALGEGRLITTRCGACSELCFPPRPLCPRCHAAAPAWVELRGRGRLYSRTRIDLDVGVRLLMRLMPSASALPLDSSVQVVVLRHPDGPLFAAEAVG